MAITHYQSTGVIGAANDFSPDASFSTTPTTGRYVVVCAYAGSVHQDLGTLSCADNQSNSYEPVYSVDFSARNQHRYWVAPIDTASGTFTVTVSVAGMEGWSNAYIRFSISEVSGLDEADYHDQTASGSGSSTTASANPSAQQSDTWVFAQCVQSWDVSMDEASGWTEIYHPDNIHSVIRREGDYDPSWTLGYANDWYVSACGFNASAGGAGKSTKNTRSFPLGIAAGMNRRM